MHTRCQATLNHLALYAITATRPTRRIGSLQHPYYGDAYPSIDVGSEPYQMPKNVHVTSNSR